MKMDSISIKRIATCHPKVVSELGDILIECEKQDCSIRITRALATYTEQEELYKKYLAGGPKAAPPGLSYHNYGLGVDFCLYHKDGSISFDMKEDMDNDKKADWMEVVNIFTSKGWKWGVSFGDNDHMEKSFGYSVQQLLQMYKDRKVDKNNYILI